MTNSLGDTVTDPTHLRDDEREALARANAAAPGPWLHDTMNDQVYGHDTNGRVVFINTYGGPDDPEAAFIAAARSDVPMLAERLAEARQDYADAQARYARAWNALCAIGDALDSASHPTLIPNLPPSSNQTD